MKPFHKLSLFVILGACGQAKFTSSTAPVKPLEPPKIETVQESNNVSAATQPAATGDGLPAATGDGLPVDPKVLPSPTPSSPPGTSGVFGGVDDGTSEGAVGIVYNLASIKDEIYARTPSTNPDGSFKAFLGPALPDFSKLTPVGQVLNKRFDLPVTDFLTGFPGIDASLKEYFGIGFTGKIVIPESGSYKFDLAADDGAIFSINSTEVVNNDGIHGFRESTGTVNLSAGSYPFTLNYMQMPRTQVGLTLWWTLPSGGARAIVPASAIKRPN